MKSLQNIQVKEILPFPLAAAGILGPDLVI